MRRHHHRAHTLAECLVVIFLVGAILSTISMALSAMLRMDRRVRDALVYDRGLDRFAERLRSDAHQAESAHVANPDDPGGPATVLALGLAGDREIRYTIRPERIERVVRRGDRVEHRERYRLLAQPAAWQVRSAGAGGQIVSVVVALRARGRSGDVSRRWRIDAMCAGRAGVESQ